MINELEREAEEYGFYLGLLEHSKSDMVSSDI